MNPFTRCVIAPCLGFVLLSTPLAAQSAPGPGAASTTRPGIIVPGEVALGSLMTLGDGYLHKLADAFGQFGLTAEAQSAQWDSIKVPLTALAARNVDALVWFADPEGSYWSVQQGQASGNLWDRDYFQRVLKGETVIGPLVVSKATGKSTAIVAAPVVGAGGVVVGVLGASVYLDVLSERLTREMAIGEDVIFYSFGWPDQKPLGDPHPLLALEWDPELIFVDPFDLGPELRAVFEYMLSRTEGTVRYQWANRWRTAVFRRSPVTGWWYVFGVVGGHSAAVRPR